jgi:hypothetical protein
VIGSDIMMALDECPPGTGIGLWSCGVYFEFHIAKLAQTQSSGRSSNATPGAMPPSGSPTAGS